MDTRVIHGVIVLSVLSAGCGERGADDASPGPVETAGTPAPGASESPGPLPCGDQEVTVTFGLNAEHESDPKKCELLDVDPDNVPVCFDTKKITWEYVNACAEDMKVRIGANRRQKYGKYKKEKERDPLVGGGDFEVLKPVGAQKKVTVSAKVKGMNDAPDGLYKYDVEGEDGQGKAWNVDPEIDVRRTTRRQR